MVHLLHLYERVKWWDGRECTAEDVAFSLQRMIEPDQPRPSVRPLRPMTKTAEVVDRHPVRVRLLYPVPSLDPRRQGYKSL